MSPLGSPKKHVANWPYNNLFLPNGKKTSGGDILEWLIEKVIISL